MQSGVELAGQVAAGLAAMSTLDSGEAGLGALVDLSVLATKLIAWGARRSTPDQEGTTANTQAGSAGRRMGPPPPRDTILTHLLVPDQTMLGLDDQPATLITPSGEVPIPAELARQLAHDPDQAIWQTIYLNPATGAATDVSRTYRPPKKIATWCGVRDGFQTRFPTASTRRVELNHVRRYNHLDPAHGGQTTAANLAFEGKRTHQGHTDGATHITGAANGTLTNDTGTGHSYQSWPHQYLDPADPAPPGRPAPLPKPRQAKHPGEPGKPSDPSSPSGPKQLGQPKPDYTDPPF